MSFNKTNPKTKLTALAAIAITLLMWYRMFLKSGSLTMNRIWLNTGLHEKCLSRVPRCGTSRQPFL